MSEVDVLVVFSNRYHYGINLIDVEVVKTRFLFFFRLGKTVSACNRKQEIDKTQIEPNPCYFPRENFGKRSNETTPSYLGNVKYI